MLNILIVGVGGQGTLLASRILGAIASIEGKICKLSEVHGMSQRGGSVVTHVRVGDKVYSPTIPEGDADIILAFEKLEGFRWRHFLKKGGTLLVNDQEILPMPVITGAVPYPKDIYEIMKNEGINVKAVDASKIAEESGSTRAVNTVMLGAMIAYTDTPYETAEKALEMCVKEKFLQMNKIALRKGYDSAIIER